MELNFKDEDKLKAFLEAINYNFNIIIRKTASGIIIEDLDAETIDKLETYDSLVEELDEVIAENDELQGRIFELESELDSKNK